MWNKFKATNLFFVTNALQKNKSDNSANNFKNHKFSVVSENPIL